MRGEARIRVIVSGATLLVVLALAGGLAFGPGASGQVPPCDGYTGYGGYTDPCPTVTPTPTATPTTQPTVVPTTVPTATPVPPPRDTRPCRVTARHLGRPCAPFAARGCAYA